ncbi:hypothetical protein [Microbacterium sp. T2.11-28]|uniref:hypothetical protein n=1 Tax=Microbacterium sp. T2.11-28 TaxID=3041169 RepID=UPI00247731DF|nr:hypothetical protein [Microbacterium sp. T2.11-28]CAI9391136.1 hypothetical protein MICABA_01674 [Microbacterium sp. T2.11-28]
MSSETSRPRTAVTGAPVAGAVVPRTAVPLGITDPVEKARAELKAALAAIEEKANVPKRVARATERGVVAVRRFHRENPSAAVAAAVGVAAAAGLAVWGLVRLYTR